MAKRKNCPTCGDELVTMHKKLTQASPRDIKPFVCTLRVSYVEELDETRKCAQEIEYVAQFDEFPLTLADLMLKPGNWIRTFSSTSDDIPPELAMIFKQMRRAS